MFLKLFRLTMRHLGAKQCTNITIIYDYSAKAMNFLILFFDHLTATIRTVISNCTSCFSRVVKQCS